MDANLKKKWIDALRSGEYKQGEGFLHSHNDSLRFCCLGVLCEIEGLKRVERSGDYLAPITEDMIVMGDGGPRLQNRYDVDGITSVNSVNMNARFGGTLPSFLSNRYGLNKRVQMNKKRVQLQHKLAEMNDGDASFEDIANYLESIDF